MLQPHDEAPHFTVTTIDGRIARYADAWQHRPLVLVCLGAAPADASGQRDEQVYTGELERLAHQGDVAIVITRDAVEGLWQCGALVADTWGEIYFVGGGMSRDDLPPIAELADWLHWIRMKCPECEGEAR